LSIAAHCVKPADRVTDRRLALSSTDPWDQLPPRSCPRGRVPRDRHAGHRPPRHPTAWGCAARDGAGEPIYRCTYI